MQKNIQKIIIEWYLKNKRDLPFRQSHDPYKIWISEIMLQQTTVQAVIPYYNKFIERFPTIKELSNATEQEVYKYWEGLGYYRRAKHLLETAKVLHNNFDDTFPHDYKTILSLKGIGPYTASAICSIAFHQDKAAVDGNMLRVISRIQYIQDNIALNKTINSITKIADEIVKGCDGGLFNQGIMDLASSICTPRNPKCDICPLKDLCVSKSKEQQNVIPISVKNIKKQDLYYTTGYITYNNQLFLIKNKEGLLENMYCFPQYEVESPYTFIESFTNDYGLDLKIESYIKEFKHVFTHRTWHMIVYHFILNKPLDHLYDFDDLLTMPIPTAHKKILDYIKKES